jgi:hypothetical protein
MKLTVCLLALALLLGAPSLGAAARPSLTYRWFYVGSSLRDAAALEHVLALFPRAAAAGYNGVMIGGLDAFDHSPEYLENVRRFREEAAKYHIDVYPYVMMHNSGQVLARDPNLAEGLPVRDALFVVHGREATLEPDPPVAVANGGFEEAEGDQLTGWEMQDKAGESTFADRAVAHSGGGAVRIEGASNADPKYGHARLMQALRLRPFRQYHLSFWVKTDDFDGGATCIVLAPTEKQRDLCTLEERIRPTQDWTRYDLLFNSLEWDHVRLYLGVWGDKKGRIWWDDVAVEEVGLLNPLRRDGTPLTVKSADGAAYEEGRDFAPVRDPELAAYPTYHASLPLRLTANSRIKDGERLRVSYYHPIHLANYVVSCLSEPKVYDIMREELVGINALLHPRGFMMSDDEIRVANWDESCRRTHLTPGQQLAEKARRCTRMIEEIRPDAEIWDWSDMFDPMHNAVGDYYAVNGSWAGSWEGLSPKVGVVNWYGELQGKNARFFADRGHQQILAGYYDWDEDGAGIAEWLEKTKGVPGVVGAMYTTWRDKYDALEAWAAAAWGGGEARGGG